MNKSTRSARGESLAPAAMRAMIWLPGPVSVGFMSWSQGSWRHTWWIITPLFAVVGFNDWPNLLRHGTKTGIELQWRRNLNWPAPNERAFVRSALMLGKDSDHDY